MTPDPTKQQRVHEMEFRVLGPVEVRVHGERAPVAGARQRALLAILLLNADRVVPVDRLIELLWGDSAPDSAVNALQVHISQLRRILEPRRRPGGAVNLLQRRSAGYRVAIQPDQLDLLCFQRLAEQGRQALATGDPETASHVLSTGLELWRGPALADLAHDSFVHSERMRLEELRLAAISDRIEADLALGRHAELRP